MNVDKERRGKILDLMRASPERYFTPKELGHLLSLGNYVIGRDLNSLVDQSLVETQLIKGVGGKRWGYRVKVLR